MPASVIVMLGDVGVVAAIQEAHTRFRLANQVVPPAVVVGGSSTSDSQPVDGGVLIYDLMLLAIGGHCLPPAELCD